jgi:glutamate 5-kinase
VLSENASQSSATITMGDNDELRVYVAAADVSFTINGIEEDE